MSERDYREIIDSDVKEKGYEEEQMESELFERKELFWMHEKHKTMPEVQERLENLEIKNIELDGMRERYQEKVSDAIESMYESYPELKGYVGSVKIEKLPPGVYACAGPRMSKKDGFMGEVQLSKDLFLERNVELKLVDGEIPNYRGERWLAGKGIEGVIKHELGHLLHLQLITNELSVEPGDYDEALFDSIEEKYWYNTEAIDICMEAEKNLGINHKDIAQELSLYGASDYGEFFAEAISEYETQKKPRPLAQEVHRLYEIRKRKQEENKL